MINGHRDQVAILIFNADGVAVWPPCEVLEGHQLGGPREQPWRLAEDDFHKIPPSVHAQSVPRWDTEMASVATWNLRLAHRPISLALSQS